VEVVSGGMIEEEQKGKYRWKQEAGMGLWENDVTGTGGRFHRSVIGKEMDERVVVRTILP